MKTQNIKYLGILIIVIIGFVSCVKDITVDLPKPEEKIAIEGMIETDEYPIVFLTKNAAYFDIVDTAVLAASIIRESQATVIVSNGTTTDTLSPVVLNRWPYFGYQGTKFTGKPNSFYNLKVIYGDKEFTSTTFIPDTIGIDSVWFDRVEGSDSLGFLSFRWMDPAETGNYYTVLSKVEGQQPWYYRPFFGIHLIDDKLDNNNEMTYTPMTKGYERNDYYHDPWDGENVEFLELVCYKIGDTVSLKLSTIDADSYNFWSSVYRSTMTEGNPFTNPASVKSNIEGDPANGYWIGSGSFVRTVYLADSTNVVIVR